MIRRQRHEIENYYLLLLYPPKFDTFFTYVVGARVIVCDIYFLLTDIGTLNRSHLLIYGNSR